MADSNYHPKYQKQNQPNNYNNPTKFYSHFLYKALIVTIFLLVLPLFPSQAPEFINQTLNTRGWEFLHLIFVGIAVSYGLFSRRNDDSDKDNNKFDNAQSYVSRFLQVSSVFEDEADSTTSPSSTVQTWNNQYYRNEPVVVVADHDQEQRGTSSRIVEQEKPLLLPVRSLKLHAELGSRQESTGVSKRISSNSIKTKTGDLEENLKENVVLPSPIPWRSRSGRMEFKEPKQNSDSPPPKLASSPKKFSAETQGKFAEDFVRKKSIYRSPPPPPPPPPQQLPKSRTMKPSSSGINDEKDLKRSFTNDEAKDMNWIGSLSMPKSVTTTDDQSPLKTQKLNRERVSFMAQPTFMEFPKEEKEELVEKLMVESEEEEELETEDEYEEDQNSRNGEISSGDGGPDVDKKADEFIAKFREQIRLQRIESIKRSSGQINRKSTR